MQDLGAARPEIMAAVNVQVCLDGYPGHLPGSADQLSKIQLLNIASGPAGHMMLTVC